MNQATKEKLQEHSKIVADIIKMCFNQACSVPRELSQQELYNIIKSIGQSCFIQGYAMGLKENEEKDNAVHE